MLISKTHVAHIMSVMRVCERKFVSFIYTPNIMPLGMWKESASAFFAALK